MPRPVTEGDREPGGGQGPVADGRRVQDGPRAKAGSMAPRLSTETRQLADGKGMTTPGGGKISDVKDDIQRLVKMKLGFDPGF